MRVCTERREGGQFHPHPSFPLFPARNGPLGFVLRRRRPLGRATAWLFCPRECCTLKAVRQYTQSMAIEWRRCWVCEVCAFVWLKIGEQPPAQCASKACRSRLWNASARAVPVQAGPKIIEPRQVEANSPPSARPSRSSFPRRGKAARSPEAAGAPALNPADHVQPASSLPSFPAPAGAQVSCVRPGQSVVQPSDGAVEPSRFAQVVKALSTPHAFGARCPHDYANWLGCPECNPPRR